MNIKTLNHRIFMIETPGISFLGTKEQVLARLKDMDVDMSEVEIAIREMAANNDNYAHFGIFGKFIFSSKKAVG